MRALVRRIARLAPPSARRAVAGLIVDLKSLPGRFSDAELRAEPWAFRHNVGGGRYNAVGDQILRILEAQADLRPDDDVLDIGCGTGRVARPLAPVLAAGGGSYLGFDVARAAIAGCRRRFAAWPALRFEHLDAWNGDYNATGRVSELDAVFPAPDASIDLAFATSVFTHMRMAPVRRYLAECARVLRPGGRLAFTAFALEAGRTSAPTLPFQRFDATSSVVDPTCPETAIAHDRTALEAAAADAGLGVSAYRRGDWAYPPDYEGHQDLFVVTKPGPGERARPA